MHDMREGPMILIYFILLYFIFSSLAAAEEEDGPARAGIHASDDRGQWNWEGEQIPGRRRNTSPSGLGGPPHPSGCVLRGFAMAAAEEGSGGRSDPGQRQQRGGQNADKLGLAPTG